MIWVASEVRGPGADSGQIGSAPGKKAAPAPLKLSSEKVYSLFKPLWIVLSL